MNRVFKTQAPQEAAQTKGQQVSGPMLLDAADLSRVAGGLPRGGGGWLEPASSTVVLSEESASHDLPRGGGGW